MIDAPGLSFNDSFDGSLEKLKAFDLATGPAGVTALVVIVIAVVCSYYFCDWLEEQL